MKKLFLILMILGVCLNTIIQAQTPDPKPTGGKHKLDHENLIFTKYFDRETIESTKKFSISGDFTELRISIDGKVSSGKIIITLIKPDTKKLKTIEIDAVSDVSYSQEFALDKMPEYIGDWQIKIQAENAEGRYNVSINSKNTGK
jgi:hypothetical protein